MKLTTAERIIRNSITGEHLVRNAQKKAESIDEIEGSKCRVFFMKDESAILIGHIILPNGMKRTKIARYDNTNGWNYNYCLFEGWF